MTAYQAFTATTTDLFIQNISTLAGANGWTVDFFGTYSTHNRLHLHKDSAHFDIWYASATAANIVACTGYSSGDIPTAQPGVSATCQITSSLWCFIIISPHSIHIKTATASQYQYMQFGYIPDSDKYGSWTGGICISTTIAQTGSYPFTLWLTHSNTLFKSQVLINGSWSNPGIALAGGVFGSSYSSFSSMQPNNYNAGILPIPLRLLCRNTTTTTLFHPLAIAPDVMIFSGGNVYNQLDIISINSEDWLAFHQTELNGTFDLSPNILVRLSA